KIVCAVIGVRGRGRSFYGPLASRRDTAVAALCDVDANVLSTAASAVEKAQRKSPELIEDFRRVLDDKSIDAVFITTPHHWHAPAPKRSFNPNRFHGNWGWYRHYGNGDIGNDGVHDIDMACMGLGVDRLPIRITAHGSRIDLEGEREFPDNMMVTYQFDNNKVLIYEDRGWCHYGMDGFDSGNAFYGTKGYMIFSRRGYFQVYLDQKGTKGPAMRGGAGNNEHLQNFLDCICFGKQPNADALTAHLSCALVHLGEIAYRVQRVLHF